MPQISMTIKQARLVRDILRATHAENPTLEGVLFQLDRDLEDHERALQAKGPWRAVTSYKSALHGGTETLECGHTHNLRWSRHWVEDRAARRRCHRCHAGANPKEEAAE